MHLEEYVALIQRYFFYLFDDYGFRIVYKEEYRKGHGWFRVGIESDKVRILFVREGGGGVLFLGTLSAPFGNEDAPQWANMLHLLSFVLQETVDWRFADGVPSTERPAVILSFYAEKLYPVCAQMLSMFASQDAIASWWSAYERYLDEMFSSS